MTTLRYQSIKGDTLSFELDQDVDIFGRSEDNSTLDVLVSHQSRCKLILIFNIYYLFRLMTGEDMLTAGL